MPINLGFGLPALASCAFMYCLSSSLTVCQSSLSSLATSLMVAVRHPSPHIVSKALGVKRIVRQKLQPLALHFATASTKHPANFQFQVHPRIAARQIPKLTNSAVVPTLLHAPAVATGSFFERRTRLTMRALGSPKTPRTVAVGRNPESAYASHNRRARFFGVAMETPCLFSHYSQRLHSQFPCGFEPSLLLKSTHSITR